MTDFYLSILAGLGLAAAGYGLACVGRLVKAWLLARWLRGHRRAVLMQLALTVYDATERQCGGLVVWTDAPWSCLRLRECA